MDDALVHVMGRDIQERSYRFGRDVMRYAIECESLSAIGQELLRQLFRSATSVGANLQEAQAAVSRPDFVHKVGVARKEAFEARHWLRLRRDMCPDDRSLPCLQQEANELCRILSTILITARRNDARLRQGGAATTRVEARRGPALHSEILNNGASDPESPGKVALPAPRSILNRERQRQRA